MRKVHIFLLIIFVQISSAQYCYAGLFGNIFKKLGGSQLEKYDDNTIVSALKEAVSIGVDNAVKSVSEPDGYWANQAIKILIPEKIKMVADGLGKIGYQKQVDDFVLSMNRAAEKAAPEAKSIFVDAIKKMTFEDARNILNGGDTAATDYFKAQTSEDLYDAFKYIIASNVGKEGVAGYYKDFTNKISTLPFIKSEALDLDHYVTNKALEGLFYMIGEEEKRIRTDPKARVTDLLKKVFAR